jgi:HK97 family phage major capsid protein
MQSTRTLADLQRRTAAELSSAKRFVSTSGQHLDLRELVNSRMQFPVKQIDERCMQATNEASEMLRQRSGEMPNGSWYPLSALSRDLTLAGNAGLSPTQVSADAAGSLMPTSAIVSAGATIISGLSGGTLGVPVVSTTFDPNDSWVNEGASVAKTLEFAQAQVVPQMVSVVVRVSRRLLANSSVDVDALLRREISERFAMAIDVAGIDGTGTNQPLGLLRQAGLNVLPAGPNGLAPIWDHPLNLEEAVLAAAGGSLRAPSFLMSPKLAKKLRRTARVSGGDRFILEGRDLLGYPIRVSSSLPDDLVKGTSGATCSALIFGDLAEMIVGFWGPAAVDILVDATTEIKDGWVRVIARAEVGVAPRRIGAFAAYSDLLAA